MLDDASDLDFDSMEATCIEIIRSSDLEKLTIKMILRQTEEKLELPNGILNLPANKKRIKKIVEQALENIAASQEEQEEQPSVETKIQISKSSKKKEKQDGHKNKSQTKSRTESDSGDDSDFQIDRKKSSNTKPKVSKEKKIEEPYKHSPGGNSDTSGTEKDTNFGRPKTKRQKVLIELKEPKEPREAKRSKVSSSKDSTAIANLKKYVNKCGVRQVWSKVLQDMTVKKQIEYLKNLLSSLGMEGRPTLTKCAKIKAKRELQSELDDISVNNIIQSDESADPTPKPPTRRLKRYSENQQRNSSPSNSRKPSVDPKPDRNSMLEPEPKLELKSEPESESESDSSHVSDFDPDTDSVSDSEIKPKTKPEPRFNTSSKLNNKARSRVESEPGPEANPEPKQASKSKSESELPVNLDAENSMDIKFEPKLDKDVTEKENDKENGIENTDGNDIEGTNEKEIKDNVGAETETEIESVTASQKEITTLPKPENDSTKPESVSFINKDGVELEIPIAVDSTVVDDAGDDVVMQSGISIPKEKRKSRNVVLDYDSDSD